jgi:hypothetical protein
VDKCVAIVYEKERREVVDAAWMARIVQQANTGFELLERELDPGRSLDAAGIMAGCAWRFSQYYNAAEVPAARFPRLVEYSRRAESTPEFASTPLD